MNQHQEIATLASEVESLRKRVRDAETMAAEWQETAEAYRVEGAELKTRLERARADSAESRRERDEALRWKEANQAENVALKVGVERLRAELWDRAGSAETKLAAANALVQEVLDADGEDRIVGWAKRARAHLSGQAKAEPAPRRPCGEHARKHRNGAPVRSAIAREMLDQLHYQGACNTQEDDLERWAFTADALAEAITLRAAAEQRVLEACHGAAIEWVQAGSRTPRLSGGSSQSVAEAVLALREGKP